MAEEQNTPSKWEQEVMQNVLLASIKEQRRARRWGIFFKGAFLLYFVILLLIFWKPESKGEHLTSHTALVEVNGLIAPDEATNADDIAHALRKAFEASKSKAVIMRINSPGGSPVQSSYIFNEVRRLKEKYPEKKVYSVIADVGGSGGYYVAAAADEIYANESSIVGSIGVLMMNFGFVDTMQKFGVEQRSLSSGSNKLFLDPFSPVNEDQKEFAKKLLGHVHQQFIDDVKLGRGDRLKDDPTLFTGLFWSGAQALDLGLIDGFGSAGYVAREIIGEEDVVNYTVPRGFFEKFAQRMGTTIRQSLNLQTPWQQPNVSMQ